MNDQRQSLKKLHEARKILKEREDEAKLKCQLAETEFKELVVKGKKAIQHVS